MVAVAQLVERRVVVSVVEGSSPFSHPVGRLAQLGERFRDMEEVRGSSPLTPIM
jgi:hypothetical protein